MKHEEIYHTCDRCGKKIDITPEIACFAKNLFKKTLSPQEYQTISADPVAYLSDRDEIVECDSITVNIITGFREVKRQIDLCGDCRKAFERFMRNDKD